MKTLALVFAISLFSAGATHAQTSSPTSQTQSTKPKAAKPVKAATPAQVAPTSPPASPTNISQSYADEAIAALKAINANDITGQSDNDTAREALSAIEVDATKDQPATMDVYTSLWTLNIKAKAVRMSNVLGVREGDSNYQRPISMTCLQDFAKELRSLYWTSTPTSCGF